MVAAMHIAIAVFSLVVTEVSASPPSSPVEVPGGPSVFDALVEPMVRSHLAACRGVEVHKRGDGFIAGRVEGPVVTVTAKISCIEAPRPNNETQAVVTTHWSTRSATGEELSDFDHTILPPRMRCPKGDVGANIRQEIMQPPPKVCERAFTPSWEDFGVATFFAPVLIPGGEPELGERDGAPTLLFDRRGRTFELSGNVRCTALPNDGSGFLAGSLMKNNQLVGRLKLVEVNSQRVLGQWNETLTSAMAVSCDIAFRRPTKPEKMAEARAAWGRRIDAALAAR
jgi:hypothetical protein